MGERRVAGCPAGQEVRSIYGGHRAAAGVQLCVDLERWGQEGVGGIPLPESHAVGPPQLSCLSLAFCSPQRACDRRWNGSAWWHAITRIHAGLLPALSLWPVDTLVRPNPSLIRSP